MFASFDDWVNSRKITSWGTNFGTDEIAFQGWRHFKEAFVPELIQRAVTESYIPVKKCLDPFGGSGTTALACQFLGVTPATVEVNPYLCNLIESKVSFYNHIDLAKDFGSVIRGSYDIVSGFDKYCSYLPPSFIEPGINGRWIFDLDVAMRIFNILNSINNLTNSKHKRLFTALLGGILVDVSNVVINGKGRRYRKNWEKKKISYRYVDELFKVSVTKAIADITKFSNRKCQDYYVVEGDSREVTKEIKDIDLCLFSPPYPNSFDYTDVYNVELWILNYFMTSCDNKSLRLNTLSSHVQIKRNYDECPKESRTLINVIEKLNEAKPLLWSKDIPDMVGAYFHDLNVIINNVYENLSHMGEIWMVVGDSKYAGIKIPTAKILIEILEKKELKLINNEAFRSMRTSAQQGGELGLDETLITFRKV